MKVRERQSRAVTIYRSIDIIAAIRFRRYCDILAAAILAISVHQSRCSEFQASSFFGCFGSFRCCWRHVRITGKIWKAATVASVAEIGEELKGAEATEGCKIGNMVALWLVRGQSKVCAQQGSRMLALWSRREAQWQH